VRVWPNRAPKKAAGEDAPSASGRATLDLNQPPTQEAGTGGGGAQHDAADASCFEGLTPGGSYAEGAGTSAGLAAAFLEQQRHQQQQQVWRLPARCRGSTCADMSTRSALEPETHQAWHRSHVPHAGTTG